MSRTAQFVPASSSAHARVAVATPESKYFQAGSDQLTVGFSPTEQPQPASMTIDVQPTDAFSTDVQKAVEELLEDPDAPEKGNTRPPQTIDAEPARTDKDAR